MNGIWGLAGWRWLFILASLPSVLLGVMVLGLLADRPRDAAWLSPPERTALAAMLDAETRERPQTTLWPALKDIRVLILAAVQFGFTLGSYGIGIWLPLMLKEYQFSNFAVSMIAAIPYIFASAAMLAWAWHVDRTGRKIGNLVITCFLAAVGLVISVLLTGSLPFALAGLTLALIGVTSARAIFWTIPTRFLAGVGAAGGLAFINSIGTAGGFVGPALMGWLKDVTGSFQNGLLAMAGIMLVAVLLAASLKLVMTRE
jgi:nitrate/nitrite transporter NarK